MDKFLCQIYVITIPFLHPYCFLSLLQNDPLFKTQSNFYDGFF